MSDTMDPSKLKVAELRAELQDRGLDTKGNKPVLVERLREALEAETADGNEADGTIEEEKTKPHEEGKQNENEDEQEEAQQEDEEDEAPEEESPASEPEESARAPQPSPKKTYVASPVSQPSPKKSPVASPTKSPVVSPRPQTSPKKSPVISHGPQTSPKKPPVASPSQTTPKKAPEQSPKKVVEAEVTDEATAIKDEPEDSFKSGYEESPTEEMDVKEEPGNGVDTEIKQEDVKQEEMEVKEEEGMGAHTGPKRGEKRALSRSRSPEAKRARPEVEEVRVEDEPEMDKTVVTLDWYNSDLSLVINKEDFLSAQPLTMQGFGYVWHGVRATYGYTRGRVYYQVRVEDYLPVPQLEEEEQHPHVLRVGWSVNDAGLTLGEDPFSYGYGGTAKASTNLRFKDYGKKFGKGDILGCYLDLESEPIVLSFTVNGEHQGMCYEIQHSELGDQALFPHIVTKNASFKVNFGSEEPWTPPLTGYTFTGNIPLEDRVLGGQGPEKRDEGEVIMMVGLPASGKTTWVDKYCIEMVDRKYNVLGTNSLIDKMKVNGLPRRRNYSGRWEVLIERCTKCLNKLLELAYKRRRNFIIDQTNVYPSAQRRKMKGFAGFNRRAVVICPSDEDLKKRTEKREKEEGKDVPDKAVLEMKANYKLPDEGELFNSVEFIELERAEAVKLVETYNKEGEEAGFGQKKGFRGGFADRRGGFMDRRGGFGNRGAGFRGGWDRDRRGGYNDRRDRGSWNRDRGETREYSSRGGYNREGRGSGSYNRDYNSRGGYNRDSRGSGYSRERGGRSNYQSNWNRNTSTETTKSSTNPWTTTTPQGGQQGSYSGYSYSSSPAWASQGSYNYSQGNYGSNWNQQYYQQTPQQTTPAAQTQQQYWNAGYGYGTGYGTGQQYSASTTSQSGTSGSSYGQQSSWSGSGQQQWGSSYSRPQWGSGSSSYSGSSQRR